MSQLTFIWCKGNNKISQTHTHTQCAHIHTHTCAHTCAHTHTHTHTHTHLWNVFLVPEFNSRIFHERQHFLKNTVSQLFTIMHICIYFFFFFFKQMPQPVFLTMHMVEVNASNSLIPFQCSSTSNCRKFKRFSAFKINNVHMFQPFSRFKHKQHLQLSNAFHHSSTSHIHKFQSFSTFKQKPTSVSYTHLTLPTTAEV